MPCRGAAQDGRADQRGVGTATWPDARRRASSEYYRGTSVGERSGGGVRESDHPAAVSDSRRSTSQASPTLRLIAETGTRSPALVQRTTPPVRRS